MAASREVLEIPCLLVMSTEPDARQRGARPILPSPAWQGASNRRCAWRRSRRYQCRSPAASPAMPSRPLFKAPVSPNASGPMGRPRVPPSQGRRSLTRLSLFWQWCLLFVSTVAILVSKRCSKGPAVSEPTDSVAGAAPTMPPAACGLSIPPSCADTLPLVTKARGSKRR